MDDKTESKPTWHVEQTSTINGHLSTRRENISSIALSKDTFTVYCHRGDSLRHTANRGQLFHEAHTSLAIQVVILQIAGTEKGKLVTCKKEEIRKTVDERCSTHLQIRQRYDNRGHRHGGRSEQEVARIYDKKNNHVNQYLAHTSQHTKSSYLPWIRQPRHSLDQPRSCHR